MARDHTQIPDADDERMREILAAMPGTSKELSARTGLDIDTTYRLLKKGAGRQWHIGEWLQTPGRRAAQYVAGAGKDAVKGTGPADWCRAFRQRVAADPERHAKALAARRARAQKEKEADLARIAPQRPVPCALDPIMAALLGLRSE